VKVFARCLFSATYINGKPVHDFAKIYLLISMLNNTIPCANWHFDALQLWWSFKTYSQAMKLTTPSFAHIATNRVICVLRLTYFFTDVDKSDILYWYWNNQKEATLKQSCCSRTLIWTGSQYGKLASYCQEHNLFVKIMHRRLVCDYTFLMVQ